MKKDWVRDNGYPPEVDDVTAKENDREKSWTKIATHREHCFWVFKLHYSPLI